MEVNKINKLIRKMFLEEEYGNKTFEDFLNKWDSVEYQKKIKKIFKSLKDKNERLTNKELKPRKLSPYIKFCQANHKKVKEEYDKNNKPITAKQITSELGKMWNDKKLNDPDSLTEYGYVPLQTTLG